MKTQMRCISRSYQCGRENISNVCIIARQPLICSVCGGKGSCKYKFSKYEMWCFNKKSLIETVWGKFSLLWAVLFFRYIINPCKTKKIKKLQISKIWIKNLNKTEIRLLGNSRKDKCKRDDNKIEYIRIFAILDHKITLENSKHIQTISVQSEAKRLLNQITSCSLFPYIAIFKLLCRGVW